MSRTDPDKCKIVYTVSSAFCLYFIVASILRNELYLVTLCCFCTIVITTPLTFGKFKNYDIQKYVVGFLLEVCLTMYGLDNNNIPYNQGTYISIICLSSIHLDKKLNVSLGAYIVCIYAFFLLFLPEKLYSDAAGLRDVILRLSTIFIGQAMLLVLINHINLQQKQNLAKTLNVETLLKIVEEKRIEALAANSAKSDFLANMSHEIRTPMNAINGIAEVVLRSKIPCDVRENIQHIKNSSLALLSIINEILDFSKIEAGKFEIINAPYQVASIIHDVASLAQMRLKNRSVKFLLEVDSQLPSVLVGDEVRLKQIMLNFLSNATKFTQHGSIKLKVSGTKNSSTNVTLHAAVIDTGVGITEENIKKLFSSFMQIDTRKNRLVEGTGLGLAICKSLATLMHGTISVVSAYGKGSEFMLIVPQDIVDSTPIGDFANFSPSQTTTEFTPSFTAVGGTVLIVDDNEVNIVVAKGLLAPYGMSIFSANSASACLTMMRDQHFDLIFMDHMMPVMDGVEATGLMRKQGVTTPIIALTANAIAGAREMYVSSGFDGYLSKPIDSRELEKVLQSFLPKQFLVTTPPETMAELSPLGTALNTDIAHIVHVEGRKKLPLLRTLFENKDWKNYIIEVHSLKTTAKICGEEELSALACDHEAAGDTGKTAFIEESFARLHHLYSNLVERLKPCENAISASNSAPVTLSTEELMLCLKNMALCASEFDLDGMEKEKKMLCNATLAENLAHSVAKIAEGVDALDYDRVEHECQHLMGTLLADSYK